MPVYHQHHPYYCAICIQAKMYMMEATLKTPLAGNLNEICTNDDILVLLD